MKKLMLAAIAALSLFAAPVFAQEESSEGTMRINQGDIEISGEGDYNRVNTGGWSMELSPKVEYFFLNRFSAGAKLNFVDGSAVSTTVSIGPAATYYFAVVRKLGFYVDQTLQWVNPPGSDDNYFHGETGIGFDYFITPNVAVGPAMRGYYNFNGGQGLPSQGTNFKVAISAFF